MKMDKINLITKNKEQIYINAEESSEDIYEKQRMVRDLILAAIALYLIDGDRKKLLDTIKSNITELMEFEQEKILKIVENTNRFCLLHILFWITILLFEKKLNLDKLNLHLKILY